jgi:hypothetical protein
MAGSFKLTAWTPGQSQVYRTAVESYQAYLEAFKEGLGFRGGMHWKKVRGREYLYRYRDRLGHGDSLGPRTEHTEEIFIHFTRARREATARLGQERLRLQEQARFCRAALINRVPKATAKILRALERHENGQNLLVSGTAALYAYEAAAGVLLEPPALLAAASRGLTLAVAGEVSWEELLRLARRTDRSFAPLPGTECRAANRDGFQLTLLKSGLRRPGMQKTVTVPGAREPLPPAAGDLHFLTASPKFSQTVIGRDGGPAIMVVPDPRAFALNRLWLSQQENREETRRNCARRQALAVAALVLRYLPQYDFFSTELDMFPQFLNPDGGSWTGGTDLAGDLEY